MHTLKRFTSFIEAQEDWSKITKNKHHTLFQSLWWGQVFADNFCQKEDIFLLGVYKGENIIVFAAFEKVGNTILFLGMKPVLGGEELSDFGDIIYKNKSDLKQIWITIITYLKNQGFSLLQLDYVREDSATYKYFNKLKNNKYLTSKQEVAPFIQLPSSWDDYLHELPRIKRKELRRKITRLEQKHVFNFCQTNTIKNDFSDFVRLHRLSDECKEQFMCDKMERFFWDLVRVKKINWQDRLCFLKMDDRQVASILSFLGNDKILLYNSGYDPKYKYYSVGLLLHTYLIKKSIEEGLKEYDFLRGDERYKYDLGARDRQLYKINISL